MAITNPFFTPQSERSFSGLVDAVVVETGRIQNLTTVIGYVNLVIRECQALGLFARDARESSVASDAEPFVWTRPNYFRSLAAVQYGNGIYPKFRVPGKQGDDCAYFYAADDYFVFNGISIGDTLRLLSYSWAKPLLYYARLGVTSSVFQGGPYTVRKAYWDVEQEKWLYLNGGGTAYVATINDDDEEELRRRNASHWLIQDWYETIANGAKSKVYAQFGDQEKAGRSFVAYQANKKILQNSTGFPIEASLVDGG
jgi:hypothetical protein